MPSTLLWATGATLTTGASLVLATVSANVTLACAPARSVAVTRRLKAPTCSLAGVPLKVRVAALNESQLGKPLPLASVAV